ncbi:MAG: fibronectin type III domain-containing protein [Planctomycetes bacterium]|nr:fibronectin type III domain-containing protein [Planctomycetota bacterium]
MTLLRLAITVISLAAAALTAPGCDQRSHHRPYTRLSPPTLVLSGVATSQARLTWEALPGASAYNLYFSTAPGVTTASSTKSLNVVSPHVEGALTDGAKYYFILTAANPVGESDPSNEVSATPQTAVVPGKLDSRGFQSSFPAVGRAQGDTATASSARPASAQFATDAPVGTSGSATTKSALYSTAVNVR